MGKYGVAFNDFATTTGVKTALGLDANASGEVAELIELIMTGSGIVAAADIQHECVVKMCTFGAAGTPGATPTPEPFNQKSNAAKIAATIEYSAEPTTYGTVFPISWGFNQRGGMRWGVPQGEGVVIQNQDTEHGVGATVQSSAVGSVTGHGHWWEP